ncbi:MAG: VWA domain-containing protein, partial [Chloroflexaceae bacterium]|nr:VWA domain-containing protein [Chloroflexaceae bacterium]
MLRSLRVGSLPFPPVLRGKLAIAPLLSSLVLLGACNPLQTTEPASQGRGLAVKFVVGSNLAEFCQEASTQFNNTKPTLENGEAFHITCEAKGSGDVVNEFLALAQQFQGGTIPAEAPEFPTLLSVDGEIYHNQLIYQMNQLFPGQNYIPAITDSPLIAYSPMVLMVSENLAAGLQKVANNPYTALVKYTNHQQLDPSAPALPITYVHTAPTRSNSGLQTLVAQFASVANQRPENLTAADVQKYQDQVRAIQSKITRYGISTGSLAKSMAKNGPFWASVGSVYEASVIEANTQAQSGQTRYVAVYPQATFSSNIRGILPGGPWVSDAEKAAAKAFIDFMLQPETQQVAANLGLRPGVPGVALGSKFSPQFGVQSEPRYDSYRPPQPDVVAAMLTSWQEYAKKPSLVAVVVDTSGSMEGEKLSAMQSTLFNYIQGLGPKEKIALIAFN